MSANKSKRSGASEQPTEARGLGGAVRLHPPGGMAVARQIAGMSVQRASRSRLLRVTLAVLTLPVLTTLAGVLSGRNGSAFFETVLELYLRYLAPLVLAFYASQSVAEEVQGRTITYLWSRPIPRWALPLGKYLGTVLITATLLSLSLVACYLVAMIPAGSALFSELPLLALGLVSVVVATLYFAAVAAAFGALIASFPFAVMLIYVLAIDIAMSFVPGMIKVLSMTVHLRVIAGLYRPQTGVFSADPQLTAGISMPVVIVVAALWLFLAIGVATTSEYRTDH